MRKNNRLNTVVLDKWISDVNLNHITSGAGIQIRVISSKKLSEQGRCMAKWVIILLAMTVLSGCENTEGQYRHNKNHHPLKNQIIGE